MDAVKQLLPWAACGLTFLGAFHARADAPKLQYFQPAGLQRGTATTIECVGEFDWPITVFAPGAEVACAAERGKLTVKVPEDFASDRLWLRFVNDSGASPLMPLLVGNLSEALETEPNDKLSQAQRVQSTSAEAAEVAITLNGALEKDGDVDGYAVDLVTGQTLVAAVEANAFFGSPMDAILQIALPDGTVVAENHDGVGLDPRLAYTAQTNATHTVRIFAWPAQPNQQIRYQGNKDFIYRLTLTTGPYLTHVAPLAAHLDDLKPVRGMGWNVPAGGLLSVVELGHAGATQLVELEGTTVVRTVDTRPGFVRGLMPGQRRLRLVPAEWKVVEASETTEPQPLIVGTVLSGCLDQRGRVDQFMLQLEQDEHIDVAVEAVSLQSQLSPSVRLVDMQGAIVAEAREGSSIADVSLSYRPKLAGVYTLEVGDRFSSGSPLHFYRMTVRRAEADFTLSLDADAFVLSGSEKLVIPVTVSRTAAGGTSIEDIEVQAVDLPSGVTASTAVSSVKGDTAKQVKLELTSDGTPFSGQIRIRGIAKLVSSAKTSDNQVEMQRFAVTPAKFGACFDKVWLTVH